MSVTDFAKRFREARLAAGLSQTALAGVEFSPSYVSLIESGRRVPTDAALEVFARRLGTTVAYLRAGVDARTEERLRLDLDYARLALANGSPQEALDRLGPVELEGVDPQLRSHVLQTVAAAHEAVGEIERAIAILEPLLAEARRAERWLDAAEIATTLVSAYLESGDLHRGAELGDRVLAEMEEAELSGTDEHLRLATTLLWVYFERGDLLFATHRASELIQIAEKTGSARGRGGVYWNAALVAESRGDLMEAQRLTSRALALLGEAGDHRNLPRLRLHYAWLLLRSDPPAPADALSQLDLADDGLHQTGSESEIARSQVERARAYVLLGEPRTAERFAREAFDRLGDAPRLYACEAKIVLGDALQAQGRSAEAREAYRWAADMLSMMTANRQSAMVWRALGDRLLQERDLAGAVQAFDRALREVGVRPGPAPVPAANPEPTAGTVSTAPGASRAHAG